MEIKFSDSYWKLDTKKKKLQKSITVSRMSHSIFYNKA